MAFALSRSRYSSRRAQAPFLGEVGLNADAHLLERDPCSRPPRRRDSRHGTGSASTGSSADTGRASTPGSGKDTSDDTGGDPGSRRSAASGTDDDGLLGGNTGGLLDPPKDTGGTAPTTNPPLTRPDVTLPPLLPASCRASASTARTRSSTTAHGDGGAPSEEGAPPSPCRRATPGGTAGQPKNARRDNRRTARRTPTAAAPAACTACAGSSRGPGRSG